MQVTKNSIQTTKGSSDWFTGVVYIDAVAAPTGVSRLSASSVHSRPARGRIGTPIRTGRRSTSPKASAWRNVVAARSR